MVFSAHINATGNSSSTYRGVNAGEEGVPTSVDDSGPDERNTTITVNVLAALGDGSLVVSVQEPKSAPLHMAITSNGKVMSLDGYRRPTVGEYALLPLLARGLVVGHGGDVGTSWTLPYGQHDSGKSHVRVADAKGAHLQLQLHGTAFETNRGRQYLNGGITYDAAYTVPVQASINESFSTETGAGTQSLDYSAQFALQSDSLGGS